MKILKKLFGFFLDGDSWLASIVELPFWLCFILVGGYIAFITEIQPWWLKLIFVGILAVFLFVFCGFVKRRIFKKLGRKPPI